MRVVLAGRLSQLQPGQTGMESREREMVKWAETGGHEVVTITEDWQSGTTPLVKRPDLRPWVTEPDKLAQYDALVVYEGARLSRGPKAMVNEIEKWAADNGKQILTVREGLKFPAEGTEGIHWDVTHRVNHQQWLDTSRMYRNMQAHLKESGYLVGRPCFGFQVIESGDHKTLAPHPVNSIWVNRAVDEYLDGKSLREVCAWLDENNVQPNSRAGSKWSPVSLSQVFRNESLIGRRKDESGRTILKFDPIMSRDKWDALQAKLDVKASRKGVAPRQTALLTSVAVHAECGGPLYRINSGNKRADGTKADRFYYRCHGNDRNPSKCGFMIPLADLDDFVSRLFSERHFGKTAEYETVVIAGDGYADDIADVERDIRELDLDDPEFASKQSVLMSERVRLKSLPSKPTQTVRRKTGRTWADRWTGLETDADKRSWLQSIGLRVEVVKPVDDSLIIWPASDGTEVEIKLPK